MGKIARLLRKRAPFKRGLDADEYFCLYALPLMLDIERLLGMRFDHIRLRGGRWQVKLMDGGWVFTDELIAGATPEVDEHA